MPVGVEVASLSGGGARGRVLAADVPADRDSPPLDVSAMDGFAVRVADLGVMASRGLPVVGECAIGAAPARMPDQPGVMRIVTGAPVPIGADAVVRVEDTQPVIGDERLVRLVASMVPVAGSAIRRRGENVRAGETVLYAGCLMGGPQIGAAAAFGAREVRVHRRVRVAIITTGDELVAAACAANSEAAPETQSIPDWQIRDSNGPALAALLRARSWLDVHAPVHAPDDPEALLKAVTHAMATADAVFLTGGVSMGHRDFVPRVLEAAGVRVLFHKLPQRPGKPMLAGVCEGGKVNGSARGASCAVFGLPGNPVSVLVTARRIALPSLMPMAGLGRGEGDEAVPRVRIEKPDSSTLDLWWHRLVRLEGEGAAWVVGGRGSGDVVAAGTSDGFIEVPPGKCGEGPWQFYGWS